MGIGHLACTWLGGRCARRVTCIRFLWPDHLAGLGGCLSQRGGESRGLGHGGGQGWGMEAHGHAGASFGPVRDWFCQESLPKVAF